MRRQGEEREREREREREKLKIRHPEKGHANWLLSLSATILHTRVGRNARVMFVVCVERGGSCAFLGGGAWVIGLPWLTQEWVKPILVSQWENEPTRET